MTVFILRNMGKGRGTHVFDKSTSSVKILGARTESRSKFRSEDPQILVATLQNLVATATWPSGYVNYWIKEWNYILYTGGNGNATEKTEANLLRNEEKAFSDRVKIS